jgi:hypothetical protein
MDSISDLAMMRSSNPGCFRSGASFWMITFFQSCGDHPSVDRWDERRLTRR